jgi:hypothetical protein
MMPVPNANKAYVLIYRRGGEQVCSWHRGSNFSTEANARAAAAAVELAGYKTIVRPYVEVVSNGLPIGWEPKLVDHECDEIEIIRDDDGVMQSTHWSKSR